MQLRATYYPDDAGLFADGIPCVLSDEHPGGVVIVMDGDKPHLPTELVPGEVEITGQTTKESDDWMRLDVGCADSGLARPAPFAGQKWTPGTVALVRAAVNAGFRIRSASSYLS